MENSIPKNKRNSFQRKLSPIDLKKTLKNQIKEPNIMVSMIYQNVCIPVVKQ